MTPQENWARCRPWIEAALETSPGFETIEDVERLIGEGTYQVFPGRNSVAITEIVSYPRRKVLNIVHGGGNLDELLSEIEPMMCAFARSQDCQTIMGTGRKGWERVTKDRGYLFGWISMVKDL